MNRNFLLTFTLLAVTLTPCSAEANPLLKKLLKRVFWGAAAGGAVGGAIGSVYAKDGDTESSFTTAQSGLHPLSAFKREHLRYGEWQQVPGDAVLVYRWGPNVRQFWYVGCEYRELYPIALIACYSHEELKLLLEEK